MITAHLNFFASAKIDNTDGEKILMTSKKNDIQTPFCWQHSIRKTISNFRKDAYNVCGSEINPMVQNGCFGNLLAPELVVKTHTKVPI